MDGSAGEPRVIVLNGGSSSGKTSLARALQVELPGYWLRLGVDTLIAASPPRLLQGDGGLALAQDGDVVPGPAFTAVEEYWRQGVAAIAAAGACVLVEDNFVSGPTAQLRWHEALTGIGTLWVGVRCAAEVAQVRERARGDRVEGMARRQAESVHHGIAYDLEVDTGFLEPVEAAQVVCRHWRNTRR